MSPEKDIEDRVVAFAKRAGVEHRKFGARSRPHLALSKKGDPDRIFFAWPGHCWFIEFKRPGGKPTPNQVMRMAEFRGLGFHVHLCDDIDEGKALITQELEYANWLVWS